MGNGAFERLLPVLIFGAVVAFNTLGPWLRRWLKAQQDAAAAAARNPGGQVAVPRPARPPKPAGQPQPARQPSAPVSGHRPLPAGGLADPRQPTAAVTARALLSDRRRVRDALLAAAVLGPCRAVKPHDPLD